MKLVGGKFFENGVEVPIQIGNKEQIELLKQREKLMEKGLPIDVQIREVTSYTLTLKWNCPHCDKMNVCSDDEPQEDEHDNHDIEAIVDYEIHKCIHCKGEVEVNIDKGVKKFDNWKFYVKPI